MKSTISEISWTRFRKNFRHHVVGVGYRDGRKCGHHKGSSGHEGTAMGPTEATDSLFTGFSIVILRTETKKQKIHPLQTGTEHMPPKQGSNSL